ncbi:MAG: lipid-A-disaccharide synthase N-terminal domain-containing protein [Chlamydiales bacterium]|nr:lipid-A-disaccharide synthase N-terminal domain-containing protein [Chlamydiales bacterium]
MSEALRSTLYPYLGFLATFFFTARFIYQWIKSEKKQKSHVTKSFWYLSFIGNILMMLHAFVQIQFHFCLIQGVNAAISYRNLQFFHPKEKKRNQRSFFISIIVLMLLITLAFCLQSYLSFGHLKWVRTPAHMFNAFSNERLHFLWHLFGFAGAVLFALRFWLQIIDSHKLQKSHLGKNFWVLSLIGSIVTCIYAIRMQDIVYIVGYSVGIVPYIRNLWLIRQSRHHEVAK